MLLRTVPLVFSYSFVLPEYVTEIYYCGLWLVLTGNDGRLKLPEDAIERLPHISDKEDVIQLIEENYFLRYCAWLFIVVRENKAVKLKRK